MMAVMAAPQKRNLIALFNLRWALDLEGHDPCDEWDANVVLQLPEGLWWRDGQVQFECRTCGAWTEWPAEIEDFHEDNPANVCGGSPRCIP